MSAPQWHKQEGTGDVVCEHGTAIDVHCCGCHSGFLFDIESCACLNGEPMPNFACDHHRPEPRANCLMCFMNHELIQRLRDVRERNEREPASILCTDITVVIGDAIDYIVALERER